MYIFAEPDRASVKQLLQDNNLPVADLDALDLSCFAGCGSKTSPSGVIGLEIYQHNALLRSLVVASSERGTGCGQALVAAIESFACDRGVHSLYLLTETAEHFFLRQGYAIIDRSNAPLTIRQTTEFSTLCPQSAIAMSKTLVNGQSARQTGS